MRRLISRRRTFRGRARRDGRLSLLTVDWHTTQDACRLVRSFRKFVSTDAPVIVVQNGPSADNQMLWNLNAGVKCVIAGCNLHHGLGLDFGMRHISTEYSLICDPDSAIISPRFLEEILPRITQTGACSIDIGSTFYHPICLAFRTELWKDNVISFQEKWPNWDVGGELTHLLGGLRDEGLLKRTRCAGPPMRSARPGHVHHFGEVWADVFSNTCGMARKIERADRDDFDGWTRQDLEEFHRRWQQWIGDVVDGRATIEEFPGRIWAESDSMVAQDGNSK